MKNAQDKIRTSLRRLIEVQGVDMATVSRAIGKNHAYIQQYMTRGIPAELPYKTAMALARYFGTDVELFGITGFTEGAGVKASNDSRRDRHPVETIRRMMGMTIAQFAGVLGADAKTVEDIEKGRVPLNETLLFRICQTFKVEPEDLREFVPQFSEEERQMVYQYRQLDARQQRNVDALLKGAKKAERLDVIRR